MVSFLIEEHEGIRKFLQGDDSYVPISEYRYLHDRPLLRPSFITQIDDLVKKVGTKIVARKLKGQVIEDLTKHAIALGTQMNGDLTDEKAKAIVFTLRDIYNFCLKLDKNLT